MRDRTRGLELTFKTIDASHSTAAANLIVHSLDSRHVKVRRWAFGRALSASSRGIHSEVIRNLEHMPEQIRANLARYRGCMTAALRIALLGDDAVLRVNASTIALEAKEYVLIPDLIRFIRDREKVDDTVAWTVLELADLLREDLKVPRRKVEQQALEAIAEECRESVESVLPTFKKHRSRRLLEAYLILNGAGDERIQTAVADPRSLLGAAVISVFENGASRGIHDLLADELLSPETPPAVLETVRRRTDVGFVKRLLRALPDNGLDALLDERPVLGEMEFLRDDAFPLEELEETEQCRLIRLAVKSNVPKSRQLWILEFFAVNGAPEARAATVEEIGPFSGERAANVVERLLYDPSRNVMTAALRQLRFHYVPGGIDLAVELSSHPDTRIRTAANAVLADADFIEFFNRFPTLPETERRRQGRLAFKADPKALFLLRRELNSLSRDRRLRALDAVECMGACDQVEDAIGELLEDRDGEVRRRATELLSERLAPVASSQTGAAPDARKEFADRSPGEAHGGEFTSRSGPGA